MGARGSQDLRSPSPIIAPDPSYLSTQNWFVQISKEIAAEEEKSPSDGAIAADGKGPVLTEVSTGTNTGDSFTKRDTAADQDANPDRKKNAKETKKGKKAAKGSFGGFTFGWLIKIIIIVVLFCFKCLAKPTQLTYQHILSYVILGSKL